MTNLKCIKILIKIDLTKRPEKIFYTSKSPLDLLSDSKHNYNNNNPYIDNIMNHSSQG
jgi:hypothetical protein